MPTESTMGVEKQTDWQGTGERQGDVFSEGLTRQRCNKAGEMGSGKVKPQLNTQKQTY